MIQALHYNGSRDELVWEGWIFRMHELTLVRGLVDRAVAIARAEGFERIGTIEVLVGTVSASDVEEIHECFDFLKKEVREIVDARMIVSTSPARARCAVCGTEFGIESGGKCPSCGSTDVALVGGEEVIVKRVTKAG
jgi:hydrogenase nickel incorporation protein HypA/HybF